MPVSTTCLTKRLKTETSAAHERLDKSIMAANPFATRATYGQFLMVQHRFHHQIDALYDNTALGGMLPDLEGRRRLGAITQDIVDLGLTVPDMAAEPVFSGETEADIPTALGWLYVAEGSNLGAAFLLKEAEKLGLSETCGARHLAAAPEGRGLHWKTFTAALDALQLSETEEFRVVEGANHAFLAVQNAVDSILSVNR